MSQTRSFDLIQRLDTSGAKHLANHFVTIQNSDFLEIGVKTPLGVALGKAHIVAHLGGFSAISTPCHDIFASSTLGFIPGGIVP